MDVATTKTFSSLKKNCDIFNVVFFLLYTMIFKPSGYTAKCAMKQLV